MPTQQQPPAHQRLRVVIRGAVQGVGFRPFVYRLATELNLPGWVNNSAQGVFIEVEGQPELLENFLLRLEAEKPPRSFIQSLEYSFLDPTGYTAFEIRQSEETGAKISLILPDLATCRDCLNDIRDPQNRRYRYPFTNCTNCGPRFSIIEALPYDRCNTTMQRFAMCPQCEAEYSDPVDRRFHAQPNACPQCGPQLELWDAGGKVLSARDDALLQAAEAIRDGQIVAIKGIGGFHLVVDARSESAVQRLRQCKRREEKPFALMYSDLASVKNDCEVSSLEERVLLAPECPIVLLRHQGAGLAESVAPGNPHLGIMLPPTPLHHLLMAGLGFPVVATSGNVSDEPICTDEHEALLRLSGIADLFLVHNRPIARHVDDSIVRILLGREMVLRRARGYAPLPINLKQSLPPLLAVGAHLKNTVALSVGNNVFISQHIGDLETQQSFAAFKSVIGDFERLYETEPQTVACDEHPDYLSTRYAQQLGLPLVKVQHHFAHVLSCMAENELQGPALGVAWDGTGYGHDGTIWGGEFLHVTGNSFERAAHFRTFCLPGGEAAVKEPRRTGLGVLFEVFGDEVFSDDFSTLAPLQAFSKQEQQPLRSMLERELNAPRTSSVGRLFDAVAGIAGVLSRANFEGQAAMKLEFALDKVATEEYYPVQLREPEIAGAPMVIDWAPLLHEVLADVRGSTPTGVLAARFHNALVEATIAVALRVGEERVVLSGGCFQNRYLTERTVRRLQSEGFRPYWHQRVPTNDGGIALGQIMAMVPA